jgi:hypothetical protein
MSIGTPPRTTGCDCGGGSASGGGSGCAGGCGSGCGCGRAGGAATAINADSGSYVRPRFFAGQLLTEDDLQRLTEYGTAKDRLHNRYLFGAGVVCGLEVACDPCGGGHVTVRPGYALDCCGRDIVVECVQQLDVNALVRDLRISLLGADCGDPCADDTKNDDKKNDDAKNDAKNDDTADNGSRHYCLYVRHDEQEVEPVAPYDTDEPCGHITCEPSRIREGYRFVLKCERHDRPVDDICTRMTACLPPEEDPKGIQMRRLIGLRQSLADAAHAQRQRPRFVEADVQHVRSSAAALDVVLAGGAGVAVSAEQARAMVGDVRGLAAALARLDGEDPAERPKLLEPEVADKARATLGSAAQSMIAVADEGFTDRLERAQVLALADQSSRLANGEPLGRVEATTLRTGLAWDSGWASIVSEDSVQVWLWLQDQLDRSAYLTDCELRDLVEKLPRPEPEPDPGEDEAVFAALTLTRAGGLAEAVQRYVAACECAAINPPCPPCDDPDVLLACLEVRDCKVVRICATVRDHVLTGPTLRYWLPQYRWLRDRIDELCCDRTHPKQGLTKGKQLPWPHCVESMFGYGREWRSQFAPADPITRHVEALAAQVQDLTSRLISTERRLTVEKQRISRLQNRLTGKK